MAQNFSIPVAFEFLSERLNWQAFSFVALTEGSQVPASPDESVDIRLVQDQTKPHPYISETNLIGSFGEEEQAFLLSVAKAQLAEKPLPESMAYVLLSEVATSSKPRTGDAWLMRSDFMKLEETNDALLGFLTKWGSWGDHSLYKPVLVPFRRYGGPVGIQRPALIFPFLVWQRRKALRAGILGKPSSWLATDAILGTLHRRQQFPYMGVTHTNCVRAIEATITIDHLREVKHRICARADCNQIFPVDSDHGKMYCQQYCGHLVSVRNRRAAAKKAAKRAKRKQA